MTESRAILFAIKQLRAFCPPHLLEEIEGDLLQKFERDVKLFGEGKAKRRMLWNVVRFFRPGIILRNEIAMKKNQFMMTQPDFVIRPIWYIDHLH